MPAPPAFTRLGQIVEAHRLDAGRIERALDAPAAQVLAQHLADLIDEHAVIGTREVLAARRRVELASGLFDQPVVRPMPLRRHGSGSPG